MGAAHACLRDALPISASLTRRRAQGTCSCGHPTIGLMAGKAEECLWLLGSYADDRPVRERLLL